MSLDLALGVIILIAAFRGWLQGFTSQVIWIAGLIACVYIAEPVRDYAKPYVLPHLPTIQPDLVDRILWWVSAVVTYVVLVGFVTLVIKMTRRPEFPGIREGGRNDQFAGFLLGAAKGVLTVALLTAGIQKYALNFLHVVPWVEEQVKTSWAFKCNEQYQPVAKIWNSPPVQHYVTRIERMGLMSPTQLSQIPKGEEVRETAPIATASRTPKLEWPAAESGAARSAALARPSDDEVLRAVEEIKSELRARSKSTD
jgi:uncharacterized membrane protein required for colicin V production